MVAGLAPHFVFDGFLRYCSERMFCTSVCVCALCNSVFYPRSLPDIQGRDMLKVLVIPCDIQLSACFSVLEVESTCLCFVRILTQVIPFIVLAHIL